MTLCLFLLNTLIGYLFLLGGKSSFVPNEDAVSMIMMMGFTRAQSVRALKATDNDVERAADWIFSHQAEVDSEDSQGATVEPAFRDGGSSEWTYGPLNTYFSLPSSYKDGILYVVYSAENVMSTAILCINYAQQWIPSVNIIFCFMEMYIVTDVCNWKQTFVCRYVVISLYNIKVFDSENIF